MKRICLLSDTHGHLDDRMLSYTTGVDEVWHAGDFGDAVCDSISQLKGFRGVYGNIDGNHVRSICPERQTFQVEGMDILMVHIAGPFGKYEKSVRESILSKGPALLVCGHSHILKVQHDPQYGLLYMNPGAAGKHGFHKIRTMLRFSISNGRVVDLEVIELGLRGSLA